MTISFLNTGNTVWTAGTGYELGLTTDSCSLVPAGSISLPPGAAIGPGQQAAFSTILEAPPAGPCMLGLRMNQSGGAGFFGDSPVLNFTVIPAVNNAQINSSTIPATMTPGQSLYVGITVRNTGNTAWYEGSDHALAVIGTPCMILDSNRIAIRPGDMILPGQTYQFIGRITAPGATGPCGIDLQMVEEGIEFFGTMHSKVVQVEFPPNAARDWAAFE